MRIDDSDPATQVYLAKALNERLKAIEMINRLLTEAFRRANIEGTVTPRSRWADWPHPVFTYLSEAEELAKKYDIEIEPQRLNEIDALIGKKNKTHSLRKAYRFALKADFEKTRDYLNAAEVYFTEDGKDLPERCSRKIKAKCYGAAFREAMRIVEDFDRNGWPSRFLPNGSSNKVYDLLNKVADCNKWSASQEKPESLAKRVLAGDLRRREQTNKT